jgi:hypothetical protein
MPNAYWKSHSSIKHNRNFCRVQKRTVTSQVPSGYLTVCYGKLPIYRSFMMIYLLKFVISIVFCMFSKGKVDRHPQTLPGIHVISGMGTPLQAFAR